MCKNADFPLRLHNSHLIVTMPSIYRKSHTEEEMPKKYMSEDCKREMCCCDVRKPLTFFFSVTCYRSICICAVSLMLDMRNVICQI